MLFSLFGVDNVVGHGRAGDLIGILVSKESIVVSYTVKVESLMSIFETSMRSELLLEGG